jgi:hypothetical protein
MSELDTDPGAGSGEEGGLVTIVDGGHEVFPGEVGVVRTLYA